MQADESTPVIPALGMQPTGQHGLQSEFQVSQKYTETLSENGKIKIIKKNSVAWVVAAYAFNLVLKRQTDLSEFQSSLVNN